MFEPSLPNGLGQIVASLGTDADQYTSSLFFPNGSSNSRKQAQLPPVVRSLKCKKLGILPEAATLQK